MFRVINIEFIICYSTMIAFDSIYVHPLPENHRFPMEKYDLLPRQLLHEGTNSEMKLSKF